jgi:hypothetical protein
MRLAAPKGGPMGTSFAAYTAQKRESDLLLRDAARQIAEYRTTLAHTRVLIEQSRQQIEEAHDFLAEIDRRLYGRQAACARERSKKVR